jgi:indolepyruvate decarboxylase
LLQYDIFKKVTVDAVMISNPHTAPEEIDRVLQNCIMQKRPVYIELPLDIGKMQCKAPNQFSLPEPLKSDFDTLEECVEEASDRINNANNPILLAGVELLRFGLQKEALKLVERIELPFATTISSKAALPELHPQFMGIYQGSMSRPEVKNQIETSDCVLSLGVWLTDFDTGGFTAYLEEKNLINANTEQVKIMRHSYNNVMLADFIKLLADKVKPRSYLHSHPHARFSPMGEFIPAHNKKITAKRFYDRLNRFLNDDMILLAEPGDAICAAPELQIEEADNFISQAYYLSIGYCTPASLGVALANPNKRVVILSGDGAFQMTANELSTHLKNNTNAVFFLINNDGYLIERLLHEDGPYNDIQQWKYSQLPKVFSDNVICFEVWTEGELEQSLETINNVKNKLIFIELHFDKYDCSLALQRLGENFRRLAESKH